LVPASINVDQEKTIWVAEPVLEYPEWDYECFHCGSETEEHEGYLRDGECYCDSCAYDLFDQPKPKSKYTDEMWDNFHKSCKPKEEVVKSMIPDDAIIIDDNYVICDTYDKAKEMLNRATCTKNDVVQDLPDAYIVSQNNGKFWFKLTQDMNKPTKFIITAYVSKDEVAKKYIKRMLDNCIYDMDYLLNPEDYQEESVASLEEDCATEEDEANFYREQAREEEQKHMEENDMDVVDMDDYANYFSKKALCVTCGEINYTELVCEVEGRERMVCCECIEIVNTCQECNHLTVDYLYESNNDDGVCRDLCFDCKFNKPLKNQMPLAVHLAIRSDIQFLTRQQFAVLTDYAELAQLTIFEAYRYKSRCHFYDCDRMVPPSAWDAEEAVQFCCRRHCEMSELIGCHCQNVYDGSDYDDEYEEATCKMCHNSNYETNMIPRIALRESDQGVKPIVSAICIFNEEVQMSNVLAESLVDLHEYFI
jgi:hypothetical protein